jgi:molybdate/tungstate transport system substrate-binding protein
MIRLTCPARTGRTRLLLILLSFPFVFISSKAQDCTVSVLYAGSLAAVMENGLGPAFVKATGCKYQGEAQGSLGAAQMIRDHVRTPDVFISADPLVNTNVLMGAANGNLVTWFTTLASSQLVVGYSPGSKFVAKFEEAAANRIPWYEVLEMPGVRFGRGDPRIDPKGYRTIFMFALAGRHYHRPEIPGFLGDPLNPAQVFPEIVLLARVESGQFDAGVFYKHEVVAHKLPYINLPPEVNFGDSRFAASYGRESYITPSGQRAVGSPILFTITIPATVRHREAALSFVRFLLLSDRLLPQFGLGNIDHQVGGDITQMPAELRGFSSGAFAL